jgi:hypothetical protein
MVRVIWYIPVPVGTGTGYIELEKYKSEGIGFIWPIKVFIITPIQNTVGKVPILYLHHLQYRTTGTVFCIQV